MMTLFFSILLATVIISSLFSLWFVLFVRARLFYKTGRTPGPEAPFFNVTSAFPWNFWPDGRSATLLIPFIGVVVFVSREDRKCLAIAERWRWEVLMGHERGVHAEQIRRDGYVFYFRYIFSRHWRYRYEIAAFRRSARIAEENEIVFEIEGRNGYVSPQFYYARALANQYRLGVPYDFLHCYGDLEKGKR